MAAGFFVDAAISIDAANKQETKIMPLPTDPLLASQWHLNQTVFGLLDLNVLGVWNPAEGPF